MSSYETLPAVLSTLEEAQRLVRTTKLPEDSAVRLEILLQDALANLRKAMGIARWPAPTVEDPDWETLEEWMLDSVCEATDSCVVEPDGICEHGYPSWLLYLGLI